MTQLEEQPSPGGPPVESSPAPEGSAPTWQRGYPLPLLRELARPFLHSHKPHIYGAFGLPKERDIATALSVDGCAWTRNEHGEVAATALFRVARAESRSHDFAGRELHVKLGDLHIHALGMLDGAEADAARLLEKLWLRALPAACWLEIPEEHEGLRWVAATQEYVYQGTKVSAASDLTGCYLLGNKRGRAPEPLHPADALTLAPLAEDFCSQEERLAILAELDAFSDVWHWAQHYSSYNQRQTWTAFSLRGYDAEDPGFIIKPAEMSKGWQKQNPQRMAAKPADTTAAPLFPSTLAVVARVPGAKDRVRFMRLAAEGGELTRHADITDREAGTKPGAVARVHIPLVTSGQVAFCAWDARGRPIVEYLKERGLYYLDQRKPHAVQNSGQEDRIHLVIDTHVTPELREWLAGADPFAA